MFKLFIICLLTINVFAQTLSFKEERYIYAIDLSTYKKGTIEFQKNKMILSYHHSDEIMMYSNETLTVSNATSHQVIDLNKNIAIKMFFLLIEAIYLKKEETLGKFFTIKKRNQVVTLLPKDFLKNHIHMIEYKQNTKLDFLRIEFLNQDRIIIEED